LNLCHLDFDIVSGFEFMVDMLYICRESSTNQPFIMQNKANFGNDIMSVNIFITKDYEENGHSGHQKTKPKQTQFKPNKAKNKPNLTQNKPNLSKGQKCWSLPSM
jgi:hypothetical protein